MNRRTMIKTSTGAGLGLIVATQMGQGGCNQKSLSTWVQTVVGALKELSPLLPSQASAIAQAVKIAETFDKAYREGKFENAMALFTNLSGVLSQIAADAGVNNTTIKAALAVAGIAMRAIAVLLQSQSNVPAVASARRNATPEQRSQIALIERLSNATVIDQAFSYATRF